LYKHVVSVKREMDIIIQVYAVLKCRYYKKTLHNLYNNDTFCILYLLILV